METIRSLFYRNDPNQNTTNKSLFKVKDLSLSYVSIIDPMVVTYFVTMLSSIAVAISCTCIWAILYMNVALQFFVAAETAHFKKKDNDVHIMVTLSLLPTILLFWTFIMWLVISRQIEIIYLMYTTPFFSNDKQSPFSINYNNTADMETETDTTNGDNNINSNIGATGILNISTADWMEEDNQLTNARRNEEEAKQQQQQALSIHPYNTTISTTTTGNTTANNNTLGNSTTPIDNRKDIIYKIAHEYSDLLWNELQLKHYEQNVYRNKTENAENLYNKAKLLSQNAQNTYSLYKKLSLPLSEEEKQILPKYEHLENLLYNTTKTVKRAYDHTQHKFYCNWSENMLETPFNMPILNQYSWKLLLILCIILEITITAICYSSGVIDGYNASIIIVVFTGILLMLWSILDTGECCSRAFWIIWCYFSISAILTALCSLANNNWSNQFITTAVIIYISIMFTIFAIYIAYDIWILPIFEFWTSTEYLNTWYIAVVIVFILGIIAFLCAFLLYEFQNDENGWFCRLSYQLCWILPLLVMVGKTYFFPHTILVCKCSNNTIRRKNLQSCEVSELDEMIDSTCNTKEKCQKCGNNQGNNSHTTTSATTKIHVETQLQLPTVLKDNESQEDRYHPSAEIKISTPYQSAYGHIAAGDWLFYFRLVGIGYLFMLLGVLGGSVMAGYVGILNILTYCAGPVVLYCSTWSILYIMKIIFTKKQLYTAGWSFHTALEVAIQGRNNKSRSWIEIIRSLYSSPILPLWAWDYFQIHTLCLLLAFIVISIYAELVMILLFTVLILLQGYSMIEYHFYHIPITTKISLGGYKIADLHAPRRRLPVLILLSLFLANLIIMAIVTWSLTNSYNNNTTPIVYKEDMQVNINSPKYPICDTQSFYTLDIIDLAYLTQLTYFHDPVNVNEDCGVENNENLKKCLDYYFIPQYTKDVTAGEGYNWTVLNISIPTGTTDSHRVAYYGIKSENTKVIVVGVRGTTTGRDWLEDFNLYTESCLLQLFSLVIPMTYIWPYSATAALVKALSFTQKILYSTQQNNIEASYYYEPVQSYAEELQFLYPDYNIILLGHSLGGATAQIAAARMNIRGIGFEPPGIVFTKEKFRIAQDSKDTGINRNLISILRNNDPISYIDEHAGEIQHLDCNSRFLTAYCHYTMPIICHLMANCNATERVSFDHWGGGYAYCGMT